MFDISWGEMLVVGVVALLVIGPKELPSVIRSVGKGAAKLRTMAAEFRGQFDEAMREAELHEVKKTFDDAKATATGLATSTFDPIRSQLNEAAESVKGEATAAAGAAALNQTIASIEADARALEAELATPAPPVGAAPPPASEQASAALSALPEPPAPAKTA